MGASGGATEGPDMGGGVDEDVSMGVAAVVAFCHLDELVADVFSYSHRKGRRFFASLQVFLQVFDGDMATHT